MALEAGCLFEVLLHPNFENCTMSYFLKVIATFFALNAVLAYGAEITVTRNIDPRVTDGFPVALIRGELKAGDSARFARLVAEQRFHVVVLDSGGGSLVEAIKIGEMVSQLRLPTKVAKEALCASACFFIWINGATRSASTFDRGRIGLHRPYIPTMDNSAEGVSGQSKAMNFARKYLEEKFVPQKFIETMLARSSNEIHFLTRAELREIGSNRQDLRELYIAKCGNDSFTVGDKQFEAEEKGDAGTASMLKQLHERIRDCEVDLDFAAKKPVIERIKAGWIPQVLF